MRQKLSPLIFKALPTFAGVFTVFSLTWAIATYYIGLSVKTPLVGLMLAFFVPFAFLVAAIHVALMALEHGEDAPGVIRFYADSTGAHHGLLLVHPSRHFGFGIGVSLYNLENGFEILIGEGEIVNIQADLKIQIAITDVKATAETYWSALRGNLPDALAKLHVRPGRQVQRIH